MEIFKIDLFLMKSTVFTPKGDVRELPKGATPVDLAYTKSVPELGNLCVGAKVNGKIVRSRYVLKSGDTVEILTNPSHKPSKDWLSFVTTSKAKQRYGNGLDAAAGRRCSNSKTLIEKELTKRDIGLNKFLKSPELQTITKDFGFETIDDLFRGRWMWEPYTPLQVLGKVIPEEEK